VLYGLPQSHTTASTLGEDFSEKMADMLKVAKAKIDAMPKPEFDCIFVTKEAMERFSDLVELQDAAAEMYQQGALGFIGTPIYESEHPDEDALVRRLCDGKGSMVMNMEDGAVDLTFRLVRSAPVEAGYAFLF
jgi:hypothetical protein